MTVLFFKSIIILFLQTLSTQSKTLGYFLAKTISLVLTAAKYKPFISLTADELVFGYDDALVSLAHKFYPRNKRPMSKMGLLNGVSVLYFRMIFYNIQWVDFNLNDSITLIIDYTDL